MKRKTIFLNTFTEYNITSYNTYLNKQSFQTSTLYILLGIYDKSCKIIIIYITPDVPYKMTCHIIA